MLKRTSLLLIAALLLMPAIASADTADVARGLVKTYANASVQLEGIMNARAESKGATKVRVPSQKVITSGFVVDASGLVVCSLAKLNPLAGGKSFSVRGMALILKGKVTGLTMRLPDGTTVPARIVLSDTKLDLAFVAPSAPLSADQKTNIKAVPLANGKAKILDEIIALSRASASLNYTPICTIKRIMAVLTKPHLGYIAAVKAGSMIFTADGKLLGIVVTQKQKGTVNASSGKAAISSNPIILPASNIKALIAEALDAAKKAPTAAPTPAPKSRSKPTEPTPPAGLAPGEV
jgi:hypothetical protein